MTENILSGGEFYPLAFIEFLKPVQPLTAHNDTPPAELVVSGRSLDGGVSSPRARFLPPLTGAGEVGGRQTDEALNIPLPFMPLHRWRGKRLSAQTEINPGSAKPLRVLCQRRRLYEPNKIQLFLGLG